MYVCTFSLLIHLSHHQSVDELVHLVRLLVEIEEVEVEVEVAFIVEEEHVDVVLPEVVVGELLHEEVVRVVPVVEEIVFHKIEGRWEKEPTVVLHEFTQTPGPSSHIDSDSTPRDLFCRFFTDDVWDLLVTETNKYAAENASTAPHTRPWYDTTVPEMKAFVGMLIVMGIVVLPRLEIYWTTSHPLVTTSGIASVMPLVRFEQLFRFLHLNDNSHQLPSDDPGHDKLFRIRDTKTARSCYTSF